MNPNAMRKLERDCIGPLGPFAPQEAIELPKSSRREVIIIGRTVKEIEGNRIVETRKLGD